MTITPITTSDLIETWLSRSNELISLQNDIAAESEGFLRVVGGLQRTIKSNLSATVAPTVTDDTSAGYSILSNWFNAVTKTLYICVDATASAAVWQSVGSVEGLDITTSGDTVYLNNETGNIVFQIGGTDTFEITPTGFSHLGMTNIQLKPNNAEDGEAGYRTSILGGDGGSGNTDGGRVVLKGGMASGTGNDAAVGLVGRMGSVKLVDSDYTVTERDEMILVDTTTGDITITLPDADVAFDAVEQIGLEVIIKKIDGDNLVIVSPNDTIDGEDVYKFAENLDSVALRSDGSEWKATKRANEYKEDVFDGLDDNTKFSVTYDKTTRIFSVTTTGNASFNVSGKKFYLDDGVITSSAHADTTGTYLLYFDTNGDLVVSDTTPSFGTMAPVAYVYYNATSGDALLFDERHPATIPGELHGQLHECIGACLVSGGNVADYTLNTAGAAALSYSVSSGVLRDESLRHALAQLSDGGPYRVLWRLNAEEDGEWVWSDVSTTGILGNGTDIYYNQNTAGVWSLAPITLNNRWVNYWLCATPFLNPTTGAREFQYFSIMGQAIHSTLAAAQAADPANSISWDHVLFREVVVVAKMIYRRVSGSSPSNAQLTEVQRYFGTRISATGSATPSSHNALSDRDAASSHPADAISVDNSGFSGNLSSAEGEDDTVQKCLETLDALVASGGGMSTVTRSVSGDDNAELTDHTIRCDASSDVVVITLPEASTAYNSVTTVGLVINVKKIDSSSNAVTIAGYGGTETIDGSTSLNITTQYEAITVQSNGTSWDVI